MGLYLRADGTWLHDGQEVTHARLAALLHRSIAVDPAGGFLVTTGRDRLPFACEDTPLSGGSGGYCRQSLGGVWQTSGGCSTAACGVAVPVCSCAGCTLYCDITALPITEPQRCR